MIDNPQINEMRAALLNIAEMCETGRQSVNDIGKAIRLVDVDAAAAITRGCFMTIAEYANAIAKRES